MPREITMPKLSDTMEEGKVLRWLKREGDAIERGEAIAEVETDKADMEMEAFDTGVLLEIRVREGETAAVGDVIGYIGKAGEHAGGGGRTGAEGDAGPPRGGKADAEHAGAEKARGQPARAGKADGDAGHTGKARAEFAGKAAGSSAETPNEEVPGPHADIADLIEPEDAHASEEGEEGSASQAPPGAPRPANAPRGRGFNDRFGGRSQPDERSARPRISPVAKLLAEEAGLDVAALEGSGPDGRVVKRDVERAIGSRGRRPAAPRAEPGAGSA
nr:E3 binding domain-containing protein [Gemmatimonadota bacterium]